MPVLSEFDLAAAWDDRPLLAVTGTNGKTTVTTMVTDMLERVGAPGSGRRQHRRAPGRGHRAATTSTCSWSRRRRSGSGHTQRFEPAVATWLNFAEDHLDVHDSLDRYEAAKARIWADLGARAAWRWPTPTTRW